MRILVTGAEGYIGRHLVPKLQKAGHYAIPLCNWPNEPHVRRYAGGPERRWFCDLSKGFGKLIEERPPDVVIHLAGRVDISLLPNPEGADLPPVPGPCDIARLYRDNVVATANVLDYCLKAGVKHLIFASTQAVYGVLAYGGTCDDELLADPLDHYAASKLAAEQVLQMGRKQGLTVSILRLPGVFGGDRREGVVYQICRDALAKSEVRVTAPYPLPLNVMHIEDVAGAFLAAVKWTPFNANWAEGLTTDVTGSETCSLAVLAHEITGLVPGTSVVCGAVKQPTMNLYPSPHLDWHPKSRKERLAQVLEEIRRGS